LAKIHRINVASTCEAFSAEDILIQYIQIMNKALPVSMWSGVLDLLCIKPITASDFGCKDLFCHGIQLAADYTSGGPFPRG